MAKVSGPLLSNTASGSVGPVLTFSKKKTGQQVRFQRKQKDVITADRTIQRSWFSQAVAAWNLLTEPEKNSYNEQAKGRNYTGYNLFIKNYEIITMEIPAGIIVIWAGLISAIPAGWLLCDGTNNTPDLRDKFIRGANAGAEAGETGGAIEHTHVDSGHSHGLTAEDQPRAQLAEEGGQFPHYPTNTDYAALQVAEHLPPFYRILFIMKT